MHSKNFYFIVFSALVLGFFMGKFLDFTNTNLEASVIGSTDIAEENEEQTEVYSQEKEWLDTYEITPQKIADQAKQ